MNKELSKMTKKEKKEYYKQFRNTWQINPVTRRPPNPKAYNRKKSRSMKTELLERDFNFIEQASLSFREFSLHTVQGLLS